MGISHLPQPRLVHSIILAVSPCQLLWLLDPNRRLGISISIILITRLEPFFHAIRIRSLTSIRCTRTVSLPTPAHRAYIHVRGAKSLAERRQYQLEGLAFYNCLTKSSNPHRRAPGSAPHCTATHRLLLCHRLAALNGAILTPAPNTRQLQSGTDPDAFDSRHIRCSTSRLAQVFAATIRQTISSARAAQSLAEV